MHRNYLNYISDETKNKIKERNRAKELAVRTGDKEHEKNAKKLGRQIKKDIVNDKNRYFKRELSSQPNSSKTWNTARQVLGQNSNLSPISIIQTATVEQKRE